MILLWRLVAIQRVMSEKRSTDLASNSSGSENWAWACDLQRLHISEDQKSNPLSHDSTSFAEHPVCPVCDMDVDAATAPRSVYRGKTYYFCQPAHKTTFEKTPERFLDNRES